MAIRVKQLDPIACFYHSHQHAAALMGFLHDPGWRPGGISPGSNLDHSISAFLQAASLDAQGALTDELARITRAQDAELRNYSAIPDQREKWALSRRLQILRAYAPLPIKLSRIRLAYELGRDPERDVPSEFEYICWFASSMGQQLARMRRARFLHDYHHQGMSRYKPGWVNTLVDNNVTLMAEFPDLDTGIFLDREDPSMREELQLTSRDFAALVDGYEMAHNSELEKARTIVDTLSSIVSHGDADWLKTARTHFSRAYEDDSAEDLVNSLAQIDKPALALERS
jgi:hypothetical protein